MKFDDKYYELLCELGMIAGFHGLETEAYTIFAGLSAMKPEHVSPPIAKATVLMNVGKADEAIKLLQEQVLSKDPDNLTAKAFVGFAHAMCERWDQAQPILEQVVQAGGNEQAVQMAKGILETG